MGLSAREIVDLAATPLGRQRLRTALRGALAPALRPVAGLYRRTWLRRVPVVAVTGSVAKTTTIRMLLAVFGLPLTDLLRSQRNGMWAVPQRLLEIDPAAAAGVVEIGIDRVGLMDRQAAAVAPDIAIITAIASEHLETMGSLDDIAREKARLLAGLRPGGVAVLNGDDVRVRAMAHAAPGPVWTYGFDPGNDVRATDVAVDWPRGMRFTALMRGESVPVTIPLLGRHMVLPALAALAAATIRGIPLARAAALLAGARPAPGRLEVVALAGGVTFVLDHTKNSAESLAVAVDLMAEVPGRHILVMATLREHGTESGSVLARVGARLARDFAHVIAIGDGTDEAVTAAILAGFPPDRVQRTATGVQDAIAHLRVLLRPGDVVLVKARSSWKLDRLVLALQGRQVACDLTYCGLFEQACADCPGLGVARTGRFG